MPHGIRSTLFDRLSLLFPETFVNTDTASGEDSQTFLSLHHVYYNRYSVQVIFSILSLFSSLIAFITGDKL